MASREKKSGGDFVLESRHLVGLFLLLVVIFGVVFTLGYLLGRSQYDSKLRAAVGAPPGSDAPGAIRRRKIQEHGRSPRTRKSGKKNPIGIFTIPPIRKRLRITCRRQPSP